MRQSLARIGEPGSGTAHDHDFGVVIGTATVAQTVANSVNLLVGIGLLAYPAALRLGGWAGLGLLVLLAIGTRYTATLIACIIEKLGGPRAASTYTDMAQGAFGKPGAIFISVCFFLELLCACTSYLIVFADNAGDLLHSRHGVTALVLVGALVVLPSTWIRDLSILSYLSILGAASSVVLVGVVLYTGLAHGTGVAFSDPAETQVFTGVLPSLAGFGVLVAGFAGHAVFPSIYCSMQERRQFGTALNWTYVVTIAVYGFVAVAGYILYGTHTKGQITLNLPNGIVTEVCLWTIVLNAVAKYSLTLGPVGETVEGFIDAWHAQRQAKEPADDVKKPFLAHDRSGPVRKGSADLDMAGMRAAFDWDAPRPAVESPQVFSLAHDEPSTHAASPTKQAGARTSAPTCRQRLCGCCDSPAERRAWVRTSVIRFILTAIVTVVAITLPFFETILGVCGAALSTTVSFIFPAAAYAQVFGSEISATSRIFHWLFAVVSTLFAVGGTIASIAESGKTGS